MAESERSIPSRPRLRRGAPLAISFGLVLLLGTLQLATPLSGDQALFLLYAQGIDEGARLYVDLWDNKQPGVFWFYWAAGKVFGFTPVGVHALDLVWMITAGALLWLASRGSFQEASTAAVIPLLTVGLYYWVSGPGFMTQVEILVALPLSACLLACIACLRRVDAPVAWPLLFGVSAALVGIFKLVLIVVPLAMGLVTVLTARGVGRRWLGKVRLLVWALLGVMAPLASVGAFFWMTGSWDAFVWTQFEYPARAVVEVGGKSPREFAVGASWLVITFLPAVPLIAFILLDRNRGRLRPVESLALSWLVAGLAAIAIQRFSWWLYHFLLLLPPAGMLVSSALDRIRAANPGRSAKVLVVVSIVAIGLAGSFRFDRMRRAIAVAMRAPQGEAVRAFRGVLDPGHEPRHRDAAFLRGDSEADPIYVFGDPRWLLEAGRRQAIPIHGWAWEFMLSEQWEALPRLLAEARPEYIHLSSDYSGLVAKRSPATMTLLEQAYVPIRRSFDGGMWYRLAGL